MIYREWFSNLWRWISSIRFAIWVLVLLSAASAIGAIVPQAPTTPNADLLYRRYGQVLYLIVKIFGFDDVFHSWWFVVLLGLFTINLSSCTVRRLVRTIHSIRSSIETFAEPDRNHALTVNFGESQLTVGEVCKAVTRVLRKKKLKVKEKGTQIVGIRWRYGPFGPDVVHVGIGIILIGVLLGVFKFQGKIYVSEKQLGNVLQPCSEQGGNDCLHGVPFGVRIEDFGVELYPRTMIPKQYWTIMTVLENGVEVKTLRVEVNRPLRYRGINFYQTFYGYDLNAAQIAISVADWGKRENLGTFFLRVGEAVRIPNKDDFVVFTRFFTTYALRADGSPMNLEMPSPQNPAATLVVHEANNVYVVTLLANSFYPFSHPNSTYAFYLQNFFVPRYVVLTYSRDPGYPVVFGGFAVVVAGLIWSFYFRPRKIWVLIDIPANKAFIIGDAKTHRLYRGWLEAVAEDLERELKGGQSC
ncbi:MAG: cytochrome c biogenesis protein ResB [Candidatus Hadarchaeum sp.]|uniref:cytochrome c biogenesis protein ResB n=1 Tax=Candidatus Hadarchaeum sp. TaxID=2883567 RepID=UPI00316C2B31